LAPTSKITLERRGEERRGEERRMLTERIDVDVVSHECDGR
jgi:hypothetical protein